MTSNTSSATAFKPHVLLVDVRLILANPVNIWVYHTDLPEWEWEREHLILPNNKR